MTDINPELIAKAADAIDVRRHDFRVDTDTWRPHCICGWSAEESHDVAAFYRHLAELAIEAVADDIRAAALEDMARFANGIYRNSLVPRTLVLGDLRERAAKLRGES